MLARWKRLPLFLFQTCIGSGIAPFLTLALEFLAEFPSPLVDLATSRGRDPCVSETVDELDEGILASHVSWMFVGLLRFHQSPFVSAAFTPATDPIPLDTGNSFCFAKVTGLNEAVFLRAAGWSGPLPSSAALPSALLVSVSDTLILSASPKPSVADIMSSDGVRKGSVVLERSSGPWVACDFCAKCQNCHTNETTCTAGAYMR
jgi:hypothetical protein